MGIQEFQQHALKWNAWKNDSTRMKNASTNGSIRWSKT